MAVPPQRGGMTALPSAQLCRERMVQYFGATLLEQFECGWSLSFRPVLHCVQPVFWCLWCSFECALEVCLSTQRLPTVDADLLMFSLRVHYRTCALRLRLLREATYELPFLENVAHDSSLGTPWNATLAEATEHICSLTLLGDDFATLTSAEVEDLLLSMSQESIGTFQNILVL
ncbi:hypothetical protein NDU88_003529 [Pleurodeles waltl]|uniref:Uncharacterized protein n=1 Tax=Pleurodeles waltl TaxID=8319 RepID=A0AAV7UD23_PLEWA|nr:hypothetical protein NDU88_003529 [Pleurodeles waltl]